MSIRRSVMWSIAEHYLVTLFGFLALIALSRLLSPAEVGVYSIAYSVAAVGQGLREFGTSEYLVQEKELTRERIRTAFGVTMCAGFFIGGMVVLLAEPAARWYGAPDLAGMIWILSLTFFLWPFGAPLTALLKREMRFDVHARISVLSGLASPIVSVGLAWFGYKYWALAWGQIAQVVCSVILSSLFRARDTWMWPSLKEWRRVFDFGWKAAVTSILWSISAHSSDLAIGRLVGLGATGIYGRAGSLSKVLFFRVWDAGNSVVLADFARRSREGGSIAAACTRVVTVVTGIGWPFLCVLIVAAGPVNLLLYGPQWAACIPLTQILALGAIVDTLALPGSSALIAAGQMHRVLRLVALGQAFRVIACVVAAFFGLVEVAIAEVLTSVVTILIAFAHLRGGLGLTLKQALSASRISVAVCLTAVAPALACRLALAGVDIHPGLIVAAIGSVATLGWLAGVCLFRHPLYGEIERVVTHIGRRIRSMEA